MAVRAGLDLAVSSLVQVTKGKTLGPKLDGHGFVPGYSKGGRWLSEDRTERPVGATILLQVLRRWSSGAAMSDGAAAAGAAGAGAGRFPSWVLPLLYNDLMDWHQWLWRERLLPPLGLSCAGSDPCTVPDTGAGGGTPPPASQLWCKKSWGMGELQGARFESLDNSPMYDAPPGYQLWNASTHRMELYDVGQTAAIVAECRACEQTVGVIFLI
jgi:hypothetical protein